MDKTTDEDDIRDVILQTRRSRFKSNSYMWTLIVLVLLNAVTVSIGTEKRFHDDTGFKVCMILVDVISTVVFLTDYVYVFELTEDSVGFSRGGSVQSLYVVTLFVQLCVLHRFSRTTCFEPFGCFVFTKLERYQNHSVCLERSFIVLEIFSSSVDSLLWWRGCLHRLLCT